MKKLAIALTIFPGVLFVIALISYVICSIAERNLPPGGVNIGLSLLLLAALINIPTIVVWLIFLARQRGNGEQRSQSDDSRRGKKWFSVAACLVTAVVIGVLASAAIAIWPRTHSTPESNRVSSIREWAKRTQHSGFTLLDQADLPGYYICVYDTGLGEIAFCYSQKNPEAADSHSFAVYDTRGRNLQDPARWRKTSELNSPGDTYVIPGMVVPVRPDYRGAVDIEFKADSGSGYQPVYKKRLSYGRKSE
ncbi:MAG: hypothetical protein KJO79_08355 [Verrucomicrobiae bacterium]|nr:hypothetical protein [Verrucomicrobiae bacterium]NNJ87178.1 hypothetical protein [Akkermansiaceae bacterium]